MERAGAPVKNSRTQPGQTEAPKGRKLADSKG